MARSIRSGWFPPLPDTGNRRSLVHVNDVADAVRHVVNHHAANGQTYIIADSQPYSGKQLYDVLRAEMHLAPRSWSVPRFVFQWGGRGGDVLRRIVGVDFPFNTEVVRRLLESSCYSPQKIERELGWRATMSLEEGVREMLGNEAPV
jgi:nucleoside-diphosphate-sugar epimerase